MNWKTDLSLDSGFAYARGLDIQRMDFETLDPSWTSVRNQHWINRLLSKLAAGAKQPASQHWDKRPIGS
eukprot:3644448-Amphidinium_carterae.1